MERIKSIRHGNVWINVFKARDGSLVVTFRKTYRNRHGQWEKSPFYNVKRGDVIDLMDCIDDFHQFEDELKKGVRV